MELQIDSVIRALQPQLWLSYGVLGFTVVFSVISADGVSFKENAI
jgi:hypothetical protein